ncbi:MAG: DUF4199 domain-containing protein [Lutibacter sp.]
MENQKSSAKQIMVNYGLLLGFLGILINLLNYVFGNAYKPHWSVGVASAIITIIILIMGIKKFKESNNGLLSLGQSLKIGIGIALVASVLGVIYTLIFVNFIEPEYYKRLLDVQQQTMIEKYPNFSDEQLEAAKKSMKMMMNPYITSAIALISSVFFGFIVSLIGGLIMKKSDEEITSI